MKKENKHHGSAKRPVRKEILFSQEEWRRVVEQFDQSNIKNMGLFLRQKILLKQEDNVGLCRNGELITVLNRINFTLATIQSDVEAVRKYGSELNQVRQDIATIIDFILPGNDRKTS